MKNSNNDNIVDYAARIRALDPTCSFIVQAPAGSGKTELLTRRFLSLLKTVREPEEILAVTFTRRAAAEMRQRLIHVLSTQSPTPTMQQWRLIENPNRLKIMTIDALCSMMVHQMPVLSTSGGHYEITVEPQAYYMRAVEKCLTMTSADDVWYDALKSVLIFFDNNTEKTKRMLSDLLAKREQWLIYLSNFQQGEAALSAYLQDQLDILLKAHLTKGEHFFSAWDQEFLLKTLSYAGQNAVEQEIHHAVRAWAKRQKFPEKKSDSMAAWKGLAEVLLTKENQWRKQFTKITGFLSPSSTREKIQKQIRKDKIDAMHAWVQSRVDDDAFLEWLREIQNLPLGEDAHDHGALLSALGVLLPVLVGFLRLDFKEKRRVDFTEVTLSALLALGEMEAPSDLALRFDYQFKHILIDEYQDTSVIQYKLFEKLVSGWSQEEGRTLFLVGDPMQSIYRFRGAEVNLFLQTKANGLGGISLEFLKLETNFRSHKNIVQWLNERFSKIFPTVPDETKGAIDYAPAVSGNAVLVARASVSVAIQPSEKEAQAEWVAQCIIRLQSESSSERIAVLVRSRRHLSALIPLLKKKNISFVAHEVEHLAQRSWVMDLMTLIYAATDLEDRISWIALLRSPLLGCQISELITLLGTENDQPVLSRLQDPNVYTLLEDDTIARIKKFSDIMTYWITHRQRAKLSHWIRGLWMVLGGNTYYAESVFQKDFETIFYWLDEYDRGGILYDREGFKNKIATLYADVIPTGHDSVIPVEIMTIHKAKGLEFDTVIIPHCEAGTRRNEAPVLLWQEWAHARGTDLLFASSRTPLYDYIYQWHKQKEMHEMARLFYVGISRAKKNVYLLGGTEKAPGSFWDMLSKAEALPTQSDGLASSPMIVAPEYITRLTRLKKDILVPTIKDRIPVEFNLPPYHDPIFRTMGTLFHRAMQWRVFEKPEDECLMVIRSALRQAGIAPRYFHEMQNVLLEAWNKMKHDPKGQWMLSTAHTEVKREWALSLRSRQGIENVVIDFAFVDEKNTRWIIDYKLLQTQDTLDSSIEKSYHDQVRRYMRVVSRLENRVIRGALYFPLQQVFQVVEEAIYENSQK